MNIFQQIGSFFGHAFTIPHRDRVKIQQMLIDNPELLALVNVAKQAATGAAINAALEHIPQELHAATAAKIATQVERAVPTPSSFEEVPLSQAAPAPQPPSPLSLALAPTPPIQQPAPVQPGQPAPAGVPPK